MPKVSRIRYPEQKILLLCKYALIFPGKYVSISFDIIP